MGYREELLKFIGDDQNFCNYLVKMNGGNTLDTLGNDKNHKNDHPKNKENQNNTSNIYFSISNQTNNFPKKSTRKIFNDTSSNSSKLHRQANNVKDPNETGQVSRKYTNLNITPMDIVTSFNEKIDYNQNNQNYENNNVKTSNNNNANLIPISETKNKLDEEDAFSSRRSLSKGFGTIRKFNNNNSQIISDKEKRTILEHYRNLYSFKKVRPNETSPSSNLNKKITPFPLIFEHHKHNLGKSNLNNNFENPIVNSQANLNTKLNPYKTNFSLNKNDDEDIFNATQKNSMFRSSIYSNLMPTSTKFFKKGNPNNNNINLTENENENELNSVNNLLKSTGKNKTSQTTYGPFLHINNKYDQKIEIKNPDIKRSLEDINYYGPHFSYCPICRFKNLDFYQNMEPHQCLKLLSYIKMKRSKIKVK